MAAAEGVPPARRGPRRLRRRLRTRIILSFLLLGTGLTALFAFLADYSRQRVENQVVEDVMNRNIDEYARLYALDPSRSPELPVQQIRAFVFPADRFDHVRQEYPEWYDLPTGNHAITAIDEQGQQFPYKLAVRKTPDAWFFLAYDMSQAARGEVQLKRVLLASILLFSALSLLIGWWSASRVMQPVTELAARLRAYRGSSHPKPLAAHFPDDEVGQLAEALDAYALRLTEVVQRDREFNADVSHELRTPLAVIRGATELLLANPDLPEKTRQRLLRIERAAVQSTDLTTALLLLSRNERGTGHTPLLRLCHQLADASRTQLGGKPIEVIVEGDPNAIAEAPEAVLAVALGNLIGNACKYTNQGEVRIVVEAHQVRIEDTGPGLSEEDAARLFERGYRGSGAGGTVGGGIGLSIVRRLCELYDWHVSIAPRPEQGAVAILRFQS